LGTLYVTQEKHCINGPLPGSILSPRHTAVLWLWISMHQARTFFLMSCNKQSDYRSTIERFVPAG